MGTWQPIVGYDNTKPVLDGYTGGFPVSMESPCPYAQWAYTEESAVGGAVTGTNGTRRITWDGVRTDVPNIQVNGMFQMLYDGNATINVAYSHSAGVSVVNSRCVIYTRVEAGGQAGTTSTLTDAAPSDTIDVPYYRYRIEFQLRGYLCATAGDWVQVDVTLS